MENEGNSQPSIPTQSSIQASPAQSSLKKSHTPTTEVPTTNVETQTVDNTDIIEIGKKLKSVVWDHFTKKVVNGVDKAECNYYKKLLGGSSKNGTKHLHQHMNICVQCKIAMGGQNKGQPVLLTKMTKGRQELVAAYDPDNARNELGCAIIMHDYPLSIVEHIGFRRYSAALQPAFQVPCQNTIKKEILKIYEAEKSAVSKMLDTNDGRVAITSDMWTTSNQKKGYMAVIAHYIDGSWTLQSFVLRFIYVPAPHTSDRLSNLLVDCLWDWNIDTKEVNRIRQLCYDLLSDYQMRMNKDSGSDSPSVDTGNVIDDALTIQEYATLLNEIGSDDEGELLASSDAHSFQD
ncbi:Zinc finger, BED-type [Sesbania bispinosa]|nr:Zinc finger, BED-type [Sesbania bispinosa]